MVLGHLQIKKGHYYVVLSYYDNRNKRHVKYVSTGLPEKGNKRKTEAELARIRNKFEPPQEVGELSSDMPFADYLFQWCGSHGHPSVFSDKGMDRNISRITFNDGGNASIFLFCNV